MGNDKEHYGYCPVCGALGVSRDRSPWGNTKCENGHTYPSSQSVGEAKPSVNRDAALKKAISESLATILSMSSDELSRLANDETMVGVFDALGKMRAAGIGQDDHA